MAKHGKLMPLTAKELCKLRKGMCFEKTLPKSAAVRKGIDKSELGLPSWFIKKNAEKIQVRSILRCQSSIWTVKVIIHIISLKYVAVRFGSGWRDFATFYGLLEGDTLLFSLRAGSNFEVYLKARRPTRKRENGRNSSSRNRHVCKL